ncbi:uncharacterized protein EAE97_001456 [Botrytis byssoidea]|uniref:Major facilitator superfamily (MFS) profile domain-containing protein n=1 Tax=Botrytis byssoidea TaxID=139641 RepID=A0A9P5IY76_9HELO|nr:uncharacterized protein EAE97_001456 [Botrytis byssoidea]KAF7954058.1 hypothetical protein EAE97_001456 [Botrytis byssoidea]
MENAVPPLTTQRTSEEQASFLLPAQQDEQLAAASWATMPQKIQLALLTLARLVEALAGGSRQSFIIFQLRLFMQADGLTPSTATIALQLSLLRSVSAIPEFFVSTVWGVLADHPRVGHKKVIILCLLISGISSIGMAFTRSFAGAMVWQLFGGLSTGKKAVLRSKIRGISGAKFESRGVLLLPAAFNAGSILGPLLGGFLSEVSMGGYWPFMLPYAMNALMKLCAAAMIALWLDGSRPADNRKNKKDARISLVPKWLKQLFRKYLQRQPQYERLPGQEYEMDDSEGQRLVSKSRETQQTVSIWTLRLLLTLATRVLVTIHIFSYPSLLSIFVSTPRYKPEDENSNAAAFERAHPGAGNSSSFVQVPQGYHTHLPFVFTGGLSFNSRDLATVLAIRGFVSCLLQLMLFPRLCKVFGRLPLYRYSLLIFPVTYFLTPYLAIIRSSTPAPLPAAGIPLWAMLLSILAIQATARSMALPAGAMLLNAACPDLSVLGTINGIGASVGAGARGLGHLVMTGWLYGAGLNSGIVGTAWWGMSAIATIAAIVAAYVSESPSADKSLADED